MLHNVNLIKIRTFSNNQKVTHTRFIPIVSIRDHFVMEEDDDGTAPTLTPVGVEKEEKRVFEVRLGAFALVVTISDVTRRKLGSSGCEHVNKSITFAETAPGLAPAPWMK